MAINDPSQFEPLLKRLGDSINKIADTIGVKTQRAMDKILKTAENFSRLQEKNRKTATQIAALEANLANGPYREQLVLAEKLSQQWENIAEKRRNMAASMAMESNAYRRDLGRGVVLSQQSSNLGEKKRIVGLEQGLKSGALQPLIKESVELEERAKKVEEALAWERLKAEKGELGAYFDLAKGKLASVGNVAGAVGANIKQAFAGLQNTLSQLSGGFERLRGTMSGAVQLAAPGAYIRYDRALKDLSGTMGQILRPAFEDLTRAIRHVADVIISLPAPVKGLINSFAKFGLVVTAVGGAAVLLAPVLAALTTGIASLVTIGTTLASVFGGPVALALGAPLIPLAAIAGLLTAGVGAWAAYKAGLLDSLKAFKPLAGIANTLIDIAKTMEGAFEGMIPIMARVAAIGIRAFEGILAVVKPMISVGLQLVRSFSPVGDMLLRIGGGIVERVAAGFARIGASLTAMGEKAQTKLGPFVERIMPSIVRIGNAISDAFDAAQPALEALIQTGEMLFDLFLEYGLPMIEDSIKQLARSFELIVPVIKVVASAFRGFVDGIAKMIDWLKTTVNEFIDSFRSQYEKLRDLLAKGNINLPEWSGGGVGGPAQPVPELKFGGDVDKNTAELTETFKKMFALFKDPPRSSINAAVRPAQFSSIEEFGRQATLSAYGMARQETGEERELRKMNATMREVAENTARAATEAAQRALGGF